MNKIRFSLLCILVLAGFTACKQATSISPALTRAFPFLIYGDTNSSQYAGVLDAAAQYNENGADYWVKNSGGRAFFFDTTGTLMSLASGVSVEGTSLALDSSYYMMVPLSNWDSLQVWNVTDPGGQVRSFFDTVISPSLFTISYPHQLMHNDSVSAGSGFTINYSNPRSDSVRVYIRTNSSLAHAIDTAVSSTLTDNSFLSGWVANTGSFSVSSGDLSGFPSQGILEVHVLASNRKVAVHHGRRFLLRSTVDASVSTFIKP